MLLLVLQLPALLLLPPATPAPASSSAAAPLLIMEPGVPGVLVVLQLLLLPECNAACRRSGS